MSKPLPDPRRCPGHLPGSTGDVPSGFIDFRGPRTSQTRCLRVVVESTLSAVHPMHRVMRTMPPRLRGAYPWSKGPMQTPEVVHNAFRVNFTLRAGSSARTARPAQPEIALRIGPIRSRSSAGVVEPDHWKHPAGLAWWYRDVPSMCASISPPYHTSSAGDFSRTDGYPNLRVLSRIALFRSPLIPGR